MAYWDSKQGKIVRQPDEPVSDYPGWVWEDCGCSGGFRWGGDFPADCISCGGNGRLAKHLESGALALYPGGPLMGRSMPVEVK